jgi:hypothetical protein
VPFSNPIVGGNVLVRTAIQSRNFVAGVSGWSINRDGSAEFNNAVIRGELVVGTAPQQLTISSTVPAELQTFYSTFYGASVTDFSIRMAPNATDYYYWVVFESSPAGTFVAEAEGWVISGVVKEAKSTFFVPGAPVGQKTQTNFNLRNSSGYVAFGQLGATNLGTVFFQDVNISWNHSNQPTADFTIDTVSQGRGVIYAETFAGTATTTTSLTEQLLYTMAGTAVFRAGRAYMVTFIAAIKSAAVQYPGVNIRETNLAGTSLFGSREMIPATGFDLPLRKFGVIVNGTAGDLTKALCITATPAVATAVSIDAGVGSAWWLIEDIGAATAFPSAPSLT